MVIFQQPGKGVDQGVPGKPAGTEIWPLEIYHSYVHSSGILVAPRMHPSEHSTISREI